MDENHLIPSYPFVQARTEMDDKCAEYEDKISALRQELRQKERKLQTELAEQVKFSLSLTKKRGGRQQLISCHVLVFFFIVLIVWGFVVFLKGCTCEQCRIAHTQAAVCAGGKGV